LANLGERLANLACKSLKVLERVGGVVSPQGVQEALHPNGLACPTGLKDGSDLKGQFRKLSNRLALTV
jgi:hypothetical protein